MAGQDTELMDSQTLASKTSEHLQSPSSTPLPSGTDPSGLDCASVQSTGEKLEKASLAPQGPREKVDQTPKESSAVDASSSRESSSLANNSGVSERVSDRAPRTASAVDPMHSSSEVDYDKAESNHAKKRSRGIEADVQSGTPKRTHVKSDTSAGGLAEDTATFHEPQDAERISESYLSKVRPTSPERDAIHTDDDNFANSTAAANIDSRGPDPSTDHPAREKTTNTSPTRKRSWDQLDIAADRNQKLVATDELKAQRLSGELDRQQPGTVASNEDIGLRQKDGKVETDPSKQRSIFGSTSAVNKGMNRPDVTATESTASCPPASSSAFAASGFAALANSSSPFINFGGLAQERHTVSDKDKSIKPLSSDQHGSIFQPQRQEVAASGFASLKEAPDSAPETGGAPSRNVFGSSFIGAGFGAGFTPSANKLTSFAAPNGDADLRASTGNIKPIGSPPPLTQDEDSGASDADEAEEDTSGDTKSETNDLLQGQDVATGEDGEQSLFASRASLFAYRHEAWKESGKGIFKFNVSENSDGHTSSNGRFILRAHQTYRVLLNAPIFKQMKVGDSRGEEPTGKSFAFAVVEGGKAIPHMVKLGDVKESRALYQAVRKLQQELE